MAIPFETVESGSSPSEESLLLPVSALYGINNLDEFGNSSEEDDGKLSASIFHSMQSAIDSLDSPIGVSESKPNPTGAGTDLIRQNIEITWRYVVDFANGEVKVYPVADSDDEIAFTDVFSGAEIVDDASSASADSVAILLSELENYSPKSASDLSGVDLDAESRELLETLTRMAHTLSDERSGSTGSAVQSKSRGNLQANDRPDNFFSNTTYSESDAPNLGWASLNFSITHEWVLDPNDQTFEVNVTTS